MDVITTTTPLLYQWQLPSGGQAQLVASATFGDLIVILLLAAVLAVLLVRMVQQWKNS